MCAMKIQASNNNSTGPYYAQMRRALCCSLFVLTCTQTWCADDDLYNDRSLLDFLSGKGIATDDLRYSMRLTGRYHQDYLYFNQVFNAVDEGKAEHNFFVRRLYIGVTGLAATDWEYRVQATYQDNSATRFNDVYVAYLNSKSEIWWRFGKQKEPMGLERLTSSNASTAQEISAPTRVFSPGRNVGALMLSSQKTRFLSLGIFDNGDADNDTDFNFAITGRAVEVLWHDGDNVLHLGLAASLRKGEKDHVSVIPEVRKVDDVDRISSGVMEIDNNRIVNIESVYIRGRFSFLSELYISDYDAADNNNDAIKGRDTRLKGGYITASYFLTQDIRPYNWQFGGISSVKPKAAGGAWEVYGRLSHTDLSDHHQGNKASIYTLGLNWYVDSNWRVMFGLVHAAYDKPPDAHSELGYDLARSDSNGNAVTARLQFAF